MLVVYRVTIILQLAVALGYTYHKSRLIRASFIEQRLEKQLQYLAAQHTRIAQRHMALQQGPEPLAYARQQGMVPARVENVHKVST